MLLFYSSRKNTNIKSGHLKLDQSKKAKLAAKYGVFEITKPLEIKYFLNKNKLNISESKLSAAIHNIMIQKQYDKSSVVLMNSQI